jgi:hypothetical protein
MDASVRDGATRFELDDAGRDLLGGALRDCVQPRLLAEAWARPPMAPRAESLRGQLAFFEELLCHLRSSGQSSVEDPA